MRRGNSNAAARQPINAAPAVSDGLIPAADWYRTYYGPDYARAVKGLLTADRTARELIFLQRAIGKPAPCNIADVGCGNGRHAIGLARAGFNVFAVDQNAAFVKEGRKAGRELVNLTWHVGDMREPVQGRFDAVLSLFNSFGFFSDEENELMLSSWCSSLSPGGIYLLDVWNRESLMRNFSSVRRRQFAEDLLVVEHCSFDLSTGRLRTRYTYEYSDGRIRYHAAEFRMFCAPELRRLFERAGLSVQELYGSLEGEPYSAESERLVVLAAKR